jgi:hypothetical protein
LQATTHGIKFGSYDDPKDMGMQASTGVVHMAIIYNKSDKSLVALYSDNTRSEHKDITFDFTCEDDTINIGKIADND